MEDSATTFCVASEMGLDDSGGLNGGLNTAEIGLLTCLSPLDDRFEPAPASDGSADEFGETLAAPVGIGVTAMVAGASAPPAPFPCVAIGTETKGVDDGTAITEAGTLGRFIGSDAAMEAGRALTLGAAWASVIGTGPLGCAVNCAQSDGSQTTV